jgi:hypothetical protein
VTHHPALRGANATGADIRISIMDIDLKPTYSTNDVPGKCIRCLAEQELNSCLLKLLGSESDNQELQRKYELLVSFLQSPDSEKLRIESERYLAEGKRVTVKVKFTDDNLECHLEVD